MGESTDRAALPTQAPEYGTPEWRIYAAGAVAETRARWEGIHREDKEAIVLVEALAGAWNNHGVDHTPQELLATALYINVAGKLLLTRLRLAWQVVRP